MRHFVLLILFPFAAHGQDLNKIKKISLQYTVGHYNFGITGRYEKEEIIEFIPVPKTRLSRNSFTITKRYVHNLETKENNLSVNDTSSITSGNSFSFITFQSLLNSLNKTKDNFNKETILPFVSSISKTEILSVAKKLGESFWFIDEETKRVDKFGREKMRKIKQFHFLDSFLLRRKPYLIYETIVSDAWNYFTISFCELNDTTAYGFQLFSLLGQPFNKTINNDYSHRKRFINTEVNNLLTNILPKKSFAKKVIGFERLNEEYILWFIDNKMWDK